MQVILCQDIRKLGRAGDVVKVKDGFARNYLFPLRKAMAASEANVNRIEKERAKRSADDQARKIEAQKQAEALSKVSCTVAVEVNDQEKLYGAITETEIIKALNDEGHAFDKKDLVIEQPIEELGIFEVGIQLHPEVIGKFRLWVTKK
jgi:large subunit ribosomal protein L9